MNGIKHYKKFRSIIQLNFPVASNTVLVTNLIVCQIQTDYFKNIQCDFLDVIIHIVTVEEPLMKITDLSVLYKGGELAKCMVHQILLDLTLSINVNSLSATDQSH